MSTEIEYENQLPEENKVYANVLELIKTSSKVESDVHRSLYLHTLLWQHRDADEEELLFKKCEFFERFTNPAFSDAIEELKSGLADAELGDLRIKSLVAYLVQSITKETTDESDSASLLAFGKNQPRSVSNSVHSMFRDLFTKNGTNPSKPRARTNYLDLLETLAFAGTSIDDELGVLWSELMDILEDQCIDPELQEAVLVLIWIDVIKDKWSEIVQLYEELNNQNIGPQKLRIPESIKEQIRINVENHARSRARSIRKKNGEAVGVAVDPASTSPSCDLTGEQFDRRLAAYGQQNGGEIQPPNRLRIEDVPESILVESVRRALSSLDAKKKEILVGLAIDQLNAPENAQKCFMVFNKAAGSIDSVYRTARRLEDEIREISAQVARETLPN